jgi:hypothetical protein
MIAFLKYKIVFGKAVVESQLEFQLTDRILINVDTHEIVLDKQQTIFIALF